MTNTTVPTDAELIDLADICEIRGVLRLGLVREVELLDFARAVLAKWGTLRSDSIVIPTETMEQEFQKHYQRGYAAGQKAAPTPQADSQPAPVQDYPPLPDFDTVEQHIYGACRRYITQDMLEPIHNLIRDAIDADRAARKQGATHDNT